MAAQTTTAGDARFYASFHDKYAAFQRRAMAWVPNESNRTTTFDEFLAEFASALAPGDAVLDVGCGPGAMNARAVSVASGAVVTVCDASDTVVSSLRNTINGQAPYPGEVFAHRILDAIPHADAAFRGVMCTSVVQHLGAWADVVALLDEVYRITAPGGTFLFIFKEGAHDTITTVTDPLYGVERSFRVYDRNKVKIHLLTTGRWVLRASAYGPDHKRVMHAGMILTRLPSPA